MGNVIVGMTLSLDGFVAGPDGDVSRLYPDLGALRYTEMLAESIRATGAVVMGRRAFAMGDPDAYAGQYEYQVPIFVLTHTPPAKAPRQDEHLTFTFVTDGIDSAIRQARAAAGDRDVTVVGGASTIRQCLQHGLVDVLQIGLMPVLLGDGLRLFERLSLPPLALEKFSVIESGPRTDIYFRVVK
jgi:dihydrofolate reductase